MTEHEPVSLENLASGGAAELWNAELEKLLENVRDVNTDPEAKRSITLEVVFVPNVGREGMATTVKVTSKLASFRPIETYLHVGSKNGQVVAVGFDPRQMDAFRKDNSVLPITPNREAAR